MEVSMCNKKFLTAVIALAFICAPAFAQVQSVDDIEMPPPQFQDHGGVTPWFWIGAQTVFSAGYNLETTAGGFRNYGGDYNTYATFNLAFVDSHYQTPKFYEVPRQLDPDAWSGHFVFLNFTSRLNSWEGTTQLEQNAPAWLAEIAGKGARIGFFTQAADLIGGITDSNRGKMTDNKPIMRIYGGNKVLNLSAGQLGQLYYEKYADTDVTTKYTTSSGAIMYAGYEQKELWNVYLTMLSEGNVNSSVKDSQGNEINKGFAGVIDFGVTPFGLITDAEQPLTFNVTGNSIAGFKFTQGANSNQSVGFGLEGKSGIWLGQDNLVLSPVLAFDGKIDANNEFFWKFGGGLIFQFSGMRWANDDWGDRYYVSGRNPADQYHFADSRYENNKVLKYSYAQAYVAYSEASDFNMLFRVEEPDGNLGFHEKLGFMAEVRLNNLTEKTKEKSWEGQARVSWDLNINQFLIIPYVRGYLNHQNVIKMRLGAYANFIPFTGFEIAYTSANLNPNADTTAKPMTHYDGIKDAGRIELVVILKSDDISPQVPKRMSDWNYTDVIQNY
jgi:hypothetical protein